MNGHTGHRWPRTGRATLQELWSRISKIPSSVTGSQTRFPGSRQYWEHRYKTGGDSGVGSYGKFAEFKADILNRFVVENGIKSVIELGCGDGNQLKHARYPRYLGFDVSRSSIDRCQQVFTNDGTKSFRVMSEYCGETAELGLSLDVIYHLVEDDVFASYMDTLFSASERFVIIYASNTDDNRGHEGTHIKHRKFTDWVVNVRADWKLVTHIPNRYPYNGNFKQSSFADFWVYRSPHSSLT